MEVFLDRLNIFILPPLLSFVIGFSLAVLSIVKGRFRRENIEFSLVCLWWSCLLPTAFISHYLFKGNIETVMTIERIIHFIFVYIPVINTIYILGVLQIKRAPTVITTLIISFFVSIFTPTEYYFKGLYSYNWGYIAKAGPAFDFFAVYSFLITFYLVVLCLHKWRTDKNYIIRLKIKYILSSLAVGSVMTLLDIPAMKGIDFYPIGNLNFIPLSILAYGVLRFRLMEIQSIIHITIIWLIVSSLVLIPNIFFLVFFWQEIITCDLRLVSLIFVCWFVANFVYMKTIQPRIDQLFNKRKFNLNQVEQEFIANISQLRTYRDLVREFTGVLSKTLSLNDCELLIGGNEDFSFSTREGKCISLTPGIERWFMKYNDLVDKSMVETDPFFLPVKEEFIRLLEELQCEFILPFIQNSIIIGFVMIPKRTTLKQLSLNELRFIKNIRNAMSIALSNSLMYQDLTNYKNNLEKRVQERTQQLKIRFDESKKQQALLAENNVQLKKEISKREKAEEEKLQAQKILSEQEKLALIGQVAGKMAHDFNNVLAIIMGQSELSLLSCEESETRNTLQLILEQTLRGQTLTKNLIAFAKSQEPKQEFLVINERIALALILMKKDLESIALVLDKKSDIPELLADSGMIEHALVNIIQNSIHALCKVQNPKITIRTYCVDNRICIEIEDNGCGIPSENLANIFEPSFTLKGSKDLTGSYQVGINGTGYGMANVKKYIEQHKGTIFVESVFGKGTKITIQLPVIKKELTTQEKAIIRNEITQLNKRILLVEDEIALSEVQYRILTDAPCSHIVDIASNGMVAMDLFDRNKYDFVSLDYILPGGITGMDVYKHIRRTDKVIPILFVSGNIEFLESIKILKQEDLYVDHISKPCQNKDYVDSINKLLEASLFN